ncbi:uncharacterized protein LOC132087907 [Daphnia carinata]|uniref:uncharacterized protein LOC132087907 n=1 Tax=Daphnia carinata TaxID=120202 RepID=UPI002868808A|nr:uncharacterized protein LOC132087907 [Daphnia carinata]
MAHENQPNDHVDCGFANPAFVLINDPYWNCNDKRRCIQGQVCLEEFRDILLKLILQFSTKRPPMYKFRKNNENFEERLETKGALEVLRYAENFRFCKITIDDDVKFRECLQSVRFLRNELTHQVPSWRISDFKNFLEEMNNALRCFVKLDSHNNDLDKCVNGFISKCERELKNVDQFQHLY